MQLPQSVLITLALSIASVSAENLLVALNSDVDAHYSEYISLLEENTQVSVGNLLSIYEQAQTYTDDSYTTLIDASEYSEIASLATELPWYSTRIAPELAATITPVASTSAAAATATGENLLVALNSDVDAHYSEYISLLEENTQVSVGNLLSIYEQAQTYTDDSYTTLIDASEYSEIASLATELPWYSTRIAPELAATVTASSSKIGSSKVSSSKITSLITKLSSVITTTSNCTSSTTSESASIETYVSTAGAAYFASGAGVAGVAAFALGMIALL